MWRAIASLPNLSANLTVTHDLPPDIRIENPPSDSFVCEDFKVEARITATDDYGLKTVRDPPRAERACFPRREPSPTTRSRPGDRARETFDIKDLGVQPGDTISFFAEAVDTCPEPHLARSKTVHLMVISTDAIQRRPARTQRHLGHRGQVQRTAQRLSRPRRRTESHRRQDQGVAGQARARRRDPKARKRRWTNCWPGNPS